MARQVAEYQAAGLDSIVVKPIDLAGLLGAIEQALDHAESTPVGSGQTAST